MTPACSSPPTGTTALSGRSNVFVFRPASSRSFPRTSSHKSAGRIDRFSFSLPARVRGRALRRSVGPRGRSVAGEVWDGGRCRCFRGPSRWPSVCRNRHDRSARHRAARQREQHADCDFGPVTPPTGVEQPLARVVKRLRRRWSRRRFVDDAAGPNLGPQDGDARQAPQGCSCCGRVLAGFRRSRAEPPSRRYRSSRTP